MLIFYLSFCLLCTKLESTEYCLREMQHQFSPPEIWKQPAVLLGNLCWKLQYEDFTLFGSHSEERLMNILMKTKHPVHILVFGVVIRDGDIMHPFISHGLRLKIEAYINCLEEVVVPWIKILAAGRPYIWQQYSVLAVRKFL